MRRGSILACALSAVACGGEARPSPPPATARSTPTPTAAATTPPAPTDASPSPASTSTAAAASTAKKSVFPPPDVRPPHERSAQAGDGKWTRFGEASSGDRAAEGDSLIVRTVLHPHPISKWISVTVAAIDLDRAAVHLVAGTDDPKSPDAPAALRTGLVPPEHQESLLAVMNGGWKTAHGRWGVMIGGHVFVPPRNEGCTVALYRDGSVRIRSWPAVEADAPKLEAYRQTPPCLLEGAELHPALAAGQEKAWGGNDPNLKTRRRSALGVDPSGRLLFYAYGEEAGAKLLAEGLRLAGAAEAAETDINYSWTRFLLFGKPKPDAPLQVTSTLVPKMVHQKKGYVTQAAPRDFSTCGAVERRAQSCSRAARSTSM